MEAVFAYFTRAWNTVLGRLRQSFSDGPIDWDDPFVSAQSFDVPPE